MKKMFFTAIALIAFSGASMASTKEVKKEKKETKKITKVVVGTECQNKAVTKYELIMDEDCGSVGCGGDDWNLLNALIAKYCN